MHIKLVSNQYVYYNDLSQENLCSDHVPFETEIGQQADKGLPFILKNPESESAKAFKSIVDKIRESLD